MTKRKESTTAVGQETNFRKSFYAFTTLAQDLQHNNYIHNKNYDSSIIEEFLAIKFDIVNGDYSSYSNSSSINRKLLQHLKQKAVKLPDATSVKDHLLQTIEYSQDFETINKKFQISLLQSITLSSIDEAKEIALINFHFAESRTSQDAQQAQNTYDHLTQIHHNYIDELITEEKILQLLKDEYEKSLTTDHLPEQKELEKLLTEIELQLML